MKFNLNEYCQKEVRDSYSENLFEAGPRAPFWSATNTDVENQITSLLEQRHNILLGGTDYFSLTSTDQITATVTASANSLTLLLGAIAGISLLVGGIGGYEYYAGILYGKATRDWHSQGIGS